MPHSVLAIAPTMFSADYGGAARIIEHIKALNELDCSTKLYTYAMQGDLDKELSIEIQQLPVLPCFHQGKLLSRGYLDVALALKILLTHRSKPDFILAYNQEAGIISRISNKYKVPAIMDVQGLLGEEMLSSSKTKRFGKLINFFEKKIVFIPVNNSN